MTENEQLEIPVNLSKDKCEQFLEYFNASLRERKGSPIATSGSARFRDDGRFESILISALPVDDVPINLEWVIIREIDGSIKQITVKPITRFKEGPDWKGIASNFITNVLSDAFNESRSPFFHRSMVCRIGADLDGEYWLPGFRFAPALPEDENSYLIAAERFFYIDQCVDAIDKVHAAKIAHERALHYSARLSLILNVSLYRPETGMRWIFVKDDADDEYVSKLEHLGFVSPSPIPESMPKKGTECRLGRFGKSVLDKHQNGNGLLMCPQETRKILRGLNNSPPNIREAFDSCARLYQTSLVMGRRFPTIQISYQVGSIEALSVQAGNYNGFSDFVRKEALGGSNIEDELLEHLYRSVRSAHFHGGDFSQGEFAAVREMGSSLTDPSEMLNFSIQLKAKWIMRSAIMNWTLREISGVEP